eukprot:96404-Chlamydomonas_euryale.AAC.1
MCFTPACAHPTAQDNASTLMSTCMFPSDPSLHPLLFPPSPKSPSPSPLLSSIPQKSVFTLSSLLPLQKVYSHLLLSPPSPESPSPASPLSSLSKKPIPIPSSLLPPQKSHPHALHSPPSPNSPSKTRLPTCLIRPPLTFSTLPNSLADNLPNYLTSRPSPLLHTPHPTHQVEGDDGASTHGMRVGAGGALGGLFRAGAVDTAYVRGPDVGAPTKLYANINTPRSAPPGGGEHTPTFAVSRVEVTNTRGGASAVFVPDNEARELSAWDWWTEMAASDGDAAAAPPPPPRATPPVPVPMPEPEPEAEAEPQAPPGLGTPEEEPEDEVLHSDGEDEGYEEPVEAPRDAESDAEAGPDAQPEPEEEAEEAPQPPACAACMAGAGAADGNSPLHLAARDGHAACVEALLEAGTQTGVHNQ